MNRYYFNFRKGDQLSLDRIGMYLRDLEEAKEEAIKTWHDILSIAAHTGESSRDREIQVADASGEPVLRIPFHVSARLH